jgi:hypothetical protein
MSSIVIAGDTSGSVTLQAPAVSGSTVLNLPATSGTIQASGAGYTTNGVAYATSATGLVTGSALTFDGTTLLQNASGASAQANFRVQTNTAGAVANGYFNINGTDYFRIYTTSSETGLRNLQNTPMYFSVNNTEGMRLTTTGLGIGTSSPYAKIQGFTSSATLPVGWVYRSTQGSGSAIPTTFGYPYLQIGAGEFASSGTAIQTIGFGYVSANGNFPPAEIGINTTSTSGQTLGDLVFGTRSVTTNTAATERMRIDSAGNVGIGATSITPRDSGSRTLELYGTTSGRAAIKFTNATSGTGATDGMFLGYDDNLNFSIVNNESGVITFGTNNTERARITSAGNVGIGTTSPTALLTVSAGEARLDLNATNASGRLWNLYSGGGGNVGAGAFAIAEGGATQRFLIVGGGSGESARIDSSGNLLVGTTSSFSARLGVKDSTSNGTTSPIVCKNSSDTTLFYVSSNGYFVTGTGGNSPYNLTTASASNVTIESDGVLKRSTSSLKYKTDVKDATHGLAEVLQLRPVTYKGKNDGNKVFGGLIAEEIHEVGLTEFVQYAEDGTPDALAYGNMVSLCVKAIQEQQALITQLTERITALEAK